MKNATFAACLIAVGTMFGIVQTASAQAWIGQIAGDMAAQQAAQDRHLCMSGSVMVSREVEEARLPSNALMQEYFTAMQTGSQPRSAFFASSKQVKWSYMGVERRREQLNEGADPWAGGEFVIEAEPMGFVRSGLYATALGQWAVRDPDGKFVGSYTGYFKRTGGAWQLLRLAVDDAANYPGPVEQFCNEPGDVIPYRLAFSQGRIEQYRTRVAKAEAKLAKVQPRFEKMKKRLEANPDNRNAKRGYRNTKKPVDRWVKELKVLNVGLRMAKSQYQQAQQAELAAKTRAAVMRGKLGLPRTASN